MWLETQRLILREFQPEDFRDLAPILADPQVMRFSPTGTVSITQTQARIKGFIACYKEFGFGKWAVILKESNQLIGYCGIAVEQIDGKDEKELGYRLNSRYWGRGLATEAASAAIKCGLEKFNLPCVLGIVERENIASVRVLEKVGMRHQKTTIFHEIEMDLYRIDAAA
jgi:[ribosomal protein S5]-alanine N-acetyltransferase